MLSECKLRHLMCLPATVVDTVGADSRQGQLGGPLIQVDHKYNITKLCLGSP
jgi:hypothetical protein